MKQIEKLPWRVCEKTGRLLDSGGESIIGSPDVQQHIVDCVNGISLLSLAAQLKLNIKLEYLPRYVYIENDEYEELDDEDVAMTKVSECNGDVDATIRFAIAKAAAAIGGAME